MKVAAVAAASLLLAGCAVPTTGVVPRSEGMYTVTRQGEGFWVQPLQLTAMASQGFPHSWRLQRQRWLRWLALC